MLQGLVGFGALRLKAMALGFEFRVKVQVYGLGFRSSGLRVLNEFGTVLL